MDLCKGQKIYISMEIMDEINFGVLVYICASFHLISNKENAATSLMAICRDRFIFIFFSKPLKYILWNEYLF